MVTEVEVVKVPAAGLKVGVAQVLLMVYTPEATALLVQPVS